MSEDNGPSGQLEQGLSCWVTRVLIAESHSRLLGKSDALDQPWEAHLPGLHLASSTSPLLMECSDSASDSRWGERVGGDPPGHGPNHVVFGIY